MRMIIEARIEDSTGGRCCMDSGLVEGSPFPKNFREPCFDYERSLAVRRAACG